MFSLMLFTVMLLSLCRKFVHYILVACFADIHQERVRNKETKMVAVCAALCLLLSLQQVLGDAPFNPVEWSTQISSTSQCGVASKSDLTNVITTVAQMITDSIDYIPRSCLEVKNGSPESPSGYYTILSDISGISSIVYCDMDNLNTCPAIGQTLTGLMSSYATLSTNVVNLQTGFNTLQIVSDVTSCEDIKNKWPWATSGWYKISSEAVYCYMGDRCNTSGPWRRVLYLDMTDPSQTCPKNFRIYSSNGVRTCGRPSGDGGCVDTVSPTSSLSYSKICGRVIGYQWGSPDGLQGGTIDGVYVDGVSLTRGNPRQHVWTFINSYNDEVSQCPCSGGNSNPSFIGNDYTCESGLTGSWSQILYTDDPIWDGLGCNSAETDCCSLANVPWFYKDLGSATTDYLELRTCGNQHTDDEDTTLEIYEIYVQ